MPKELSQFENYLVHEFVDDYVDGILSRRDMMRRVLHIVGGVAATATVLTHLGVKPASAQEGTPAPPPTPTGPRSTLSVAEDDPGISASDITFPGVDGADVTAYQAMPSSGEGPFPVVLICHENRGLTPHNHDVARRWATQGYIAAALDLLSREGGTASIADPAEIPALLSDDSKLQRHVDDFKAAAAYYGTQETADATRLGMIGFCFGGGITWRAATEMPELRAAAPYYGPPPPLDAVPNITAAVLAVYSDDPEDFANEGREELTAALEEAGVTFQINIYSDTQHGFYNDTSPRWNEEQSLVAWNDTVAWFETYVNGATGTATPSSEEAGT
ncbi:MAG TPA: dienelactone hydrolase family protein [Thermomicrobiales bacterium]|nr:dienelactone hydrolase family protein [Thermomicrobiales bacterium]